MSIVHEWFDTMNSFHKISDKQSRNTFGVNVCDQINVLLRRMTETVITMRTKNPQHKGLCMFQRAIILSNHYRMGLYNVLLESFNVECILIEVKSRWPRQLIRMHTTNAQIL